MGLAQEFKEFALRGNVVDMAVGIVIGGAFGKIVTSFVSNVIMPPVGLLLGGVNFTDLSVVLQEAQGDTEAIVVGYGAFIQSVVDFTIVALAIFLVIRMMNSFKRAEEAPAPEPPGPSAQEVLLTEIRDALKSQS